MYESIKNFKDFKEGRKVKIGLISFALERHFR